MDKITSLSQAIRVGSLSTKQCRGTTYKVEAHQEHTCAIGAAAYALGFFVGQQSPSRYTEDAEEFLFKRFPALRGLKIKMDQPTLRDWAHVIEAIVWFNDSRRWSREQIADWLEAKGL